MVIAVKAPLTSVTVKDRCNMMGFHNAVEARAMKPNSSSRKMMRRIRNE